MKKWRKIYLLIFGIIFVITLSFIPYSDHRVSFNKLIEEAPPPGFILDGTKDRYHLVTKPLNNINFKFLFNYISDIKDLNRFNKWKEKTIEEGKKKLEKKEVVSTEELFYLETEFLRKYGKEFVFKKFRFGIYIVEIFIVVFVLFLANVLYFQVLKILRKLEPLIKKNKSIILILVAAFAVVLFLIFFRSKDNLASNIIQSLATLALVGVTLSYASSTKKLVDQEQRRLEEDKIKGKIEFKEKSLQEFGLPMQYRINNLKYYLTISSDFMQFNKNREGIKNSTDKIIEVSERYAYLGPNKFAQEMANVATHFSLLYSLNHETEKDYVPLREKTITVLASATAMILEQNTNYFTAINEYFSII